MVGTARKAALLLVLLVSAAACSEEQKAAWPTAQARFSLAGSRYFVAFPPLSRVRDEFLSLVVNVEGLEGVVDLVKAHSTVDLADDSYAQLTGLDDGFAPLLFEYRGATVLAVGVRDAARFTGLVKVAAERGGQTVALIATDGPALWHMADRLAWAVDGNVAALLWDPAGQATGTLAALLLEPPPASPPEVDSEKLSFFLSTAGSDLERQAADLLEAAGSAAGLGHALLRFADSCTGFSGSLAPGDHIRLSLHASGCSVPLTTGSRLAPEALVPEDTVLLLHAAFRGRSLADLLTPVQQALVRLVWARQSDAADQLPAPPVLLEMFEPEIALAFLGLAPTASLDQLAGGKEPLEPLFAAHLLAVLPVRAGQDPFKSLPLAAGEGALEEFESREIGTPALSATEYCRKEKEERPVTRCFTLVRHQQNLLLVTGAGEGARLLRVLQGQARPLADSLFVAGEPAAAFTLTLKTRRLVRDLMAKGFPPYFLGILSSVLEVRVAATPAGDGTDLACEVVLR